MLPSAEIIPVLLRSVTRSAGFEPIEIDIPAWFQCRVVEETEFVARKNSKAESHMEFIAEPYVRTVVQAVCE